jgi:hypothetical protein
MRFNKQELITLATQSSTRFEKEGILYVRERQDGFFRKSESKYVFNSVILYFFYESILNMNNYSKICCATKETTTIFLFISFCPYFLV